MTAGELIDFLKCFPADQQVMIYSPLDGDGSYVPIARDNIKEQTVVHLTYPWPARGDKRTAVEVKAPPFIGIDPHSFYS